MCVCVGANSNNNLLFGAIVFAMIFHVITNERWRQRRVVDSSVELTAYRLLLYCRENVYVDDCERIPASIFEYRFRETVHRTRLRVCRRRESSSAGFPRRRF